MIYKLSFVLFFCIIILNIEFEVILRSFGLGFNSVTEKLCNRLNLRQVSKRDPYCLVLSKTFCCYYIWVI